MNKENAYDVIIAGAGAAGLTAAAYLCKSGYSVLLCEQNMKTGGLVSSFKHSGFLFDAGIRAFENSGIIFPMLKQLGIKIDFVKNPVSLGIADKTINLSSRDSLDDYQALLVHLFPDNRENIEKIVIKIKTVIGYMDVLYGIDNPLFLDITQDKDYLFKILLPWLVKYQINISKAVSLISR
jgi:phytoene dehydrogenase-like protein